MILYTINNVIDASYGSAIPPIPDKTSSSFLLQPRWTWTWARSQLPPYTYTGDNGSGSTSRTEAEILYTWGGGGGDGILLLELPAPNYPISTLSTIDCTSSWYGGTGIQYGLNTNPVTVDFYTFSRTTTATATGSNATTTATTSAESYSLKSSIAGTVELVTSTYNSYSYIPPEVFYGDDGAHSATPGSVVHLTGKFWVVPAGYAGGSVLEDFPTISVATLNPIFTTTDSFWTEYSSSLYTYSSYRELYGFFGVTEATSYVRSTGTTYSETRRAFLGGYENIWNISHNEAMLTFDGTTSASGLIRYAGSYGASLSTENFSPRLSCLHGDTQGFPAISEVVSYSALEGNEAGYMILGSTNIIALTTAGSDSHETTSTFSLQLLSTAESSQSIDNYWNGPVIRAGKYGGDDYKAILAGGQDWSASLYAGSNETFRVYENPSSGSTNSYSFAVNEGWFSNFSAESGGNIVVVGGRYIPPVVEYYEEDGSYRTRYATAARTIS